MFTHSDADSTLSYQVLGNSMDALVTEMEQKAFADSDLWIMMDMSNAEALEYVLRHHGSKSIQLVVLCTKPIHVSPDAYPYTHAYVEHTKVHGCCMELASDTTSMKAVYSWNKSIRSPSQ